MKGKNCAGYLTSHVANKQQCLSGLGFQGSVDLFKISNSTNLILLCNYSIETFTLELEKLNQLALNSSGEQLVKLSVSWGSGLKLLEDRF